LTNTVNANTPGGEYWNSLSEPEQKALVDLYFEKKKSWDTLGGITGTREDFDEESFLQDLYELGEAPIAPSHQSIWDDAQAAIDAENAEILNRYSAQEDRLNELLHNATNAYETDLNDIRSEYSEAMTGLQSRQYQQNAQLMDTMQSQMSKQTRNALEAGASAGLRIAGNINTMLSVQNKQSQQSLETSNQLAQMLLNQKAAERGVRNDYSKYMQQDAANRAGLDNARNDVLTSTYDRTYNRYNSEYGRKEDAYKEDSGNYLNNMSDNLLADSYFSNKQKSQYTGGTK
jgi:RNase P subunit RPR2